MLWGSQGLEHPCVAQTRRIARKQLSRRNELSSLASRSYIRFFENGLPDEFDASFTSRQSGLS